MKKTETRALAYAVAKVIDMDDLSSISGGARGGMLQWSTHGTCKASGTNYQNSDVSFDVVGDC